MNVPSWIQSFRVSLSLAALAAIAACGGGQQIASGPVPGADPTVSVQRFLDAVNTRNLYAMAGIFGTSDGPIADTGGSVGCGFKGMGSMLGLGDGCVSNQDVEIRMDAIAEILKNDSFQVISERSVAGRENPTIRVGVTLQMGEKTISDVSFVTVRGNRGTWYLEEIDLPKVTGAQ